MPIDFAAMTGGMTGTLNSNTPNQVTYGAKLVPKSAPSGGNQVEKGTFTTVTTMSKEQLKSIESKAAETVSKIPDTLEERKARIQELKKELRANAGAGPFDPKNGDLMDEIRELERYDMDWMERLQDDWNHSAARHLALDASEAAKRFATSAIDRVSSLRWTDLIKNQNEVADGIYEICKSKPYFECTACNFSRMKLSPDGLIKKLFGNDSMNDHLGDALNSGNGTAADMIIDCPGKKREMAMQGLANADSPMDFLLGGMGVISTVEGNLTTMVQTAQSGNAALFNQLTDAAINGDMKGLAKGQFDTLTSSLVSNSSTVASLDKITKSIGIDGKQLIQASVPDNFLGYATMKSAIDLKKSVNFNGLSTGDLASVVKNAGGIAGQSMNKIQDGLKQASALSMKLSKIGKAAADSANMNDLTRKMLESQLGKTEASKFL